jgi:hypothetical protein
MPHDTSEKEIITVTVKVQAMGRYASSLQASRSVGPDYEVVQVPRSQAPASGRGAAASRFGPGTGMSRDGRRHATRLDLKNDDLQAGRKILGLRRMRINLGRE